MKKGFRSRLTVAAVSVAILAGSLGQAAPASASVPSAVGHAVGNYINRDIYMKSGTYSTYQYGVDAVHAGATAVHAVNSAGAAVYHFIF